jgi:hypothetical protein
VPTPQDDRDLGGLDEELRRLLVGTNDQRRRAGQALYHFFRSLVFWHDRGRTFSQITAAWSAGGAAVFASMSVLLAEPGKQQDDVPLRRFLADVLGRLADDLERGEHMLVPFVRWLEGRFPALTGMMREEAVGSRLLDHELARALESTFEAAARADAATLPARLREGVAWLGPL